MTLLPAAANVSVEAAKVRDYLLNTGHPLNGGKAAFFAAFGFVIDRWEILREALRMHPLANEVIDSQQSVHGTKFAVRCSIATPDGRDPCITTVWIVDRNQPPRLITAYP